MEYEYEIFETRPDRSVMWHAFVRGDEAALAKLRAISKTTPNECFAIRLATQTIIGRVNQRQEARSAAA